MKIMYWLLVAIILAIMPGADAITMSITEGTGSQSFSSTASWQAGDADAVSDTVVHDGDWISHLLTGSGNMNESHSVTNRRGFTAEVATKLIDADVFEYIYTITPDDRDYVTAIQWLNVRDATYIHASSMASNYKANDVCASVEVRNGGINGYMSTAHADSDGVEISQSVNSIDYAAYAEAWTGATHWVDREHGPYLDDEDYYSAHAYLLLKNGDLIWYASKASIKDNSANADQSYSTEHSKYLEGYIDSCNRK